MLFEIIMMLQVVAFIFLILALFPYQKSVDLEGNTNQPPYLNKIVFILVATTIFFSLGLLTTKYDYNYCYINASTVDYTLNASINYATCASYNIESIDLSYLNWGMGILSLTLAFMMAIFAAIGRKESVS
jgi:hypothetical protein